MSTTQHVKREFGQIRVESKEYEGDTVTLFPLPPEGDISLKAQSPGCPDLYVVMTLDTAEQFFKSALQMIEEQRRGA